jgi:rubrerythrin
MNVFDFAMEMEDSGKAYYENLAKAASLPGLKTIFTRLAEDEQKHFEIFRDLKAGNKAQTMPESKTLDTAQNVFLLLPRGAEGLKDVTHALAAYRHAMKLEADSFRFYEEAAAKESDAEVQGLLLKIAGEEHKHFNILENIYNFVNAPNQHLVWGEFSNFDEFRQFGRDTDI